MKRFITCLFSLILIFTFIFPSSPTSAKSFPNQPLPSSPPSLLSGDNTFPEQERDRAHLLQLLLQHPDLPQDVKDDLKRKLAQPEKRAPILPSPEVIPETSIQVQTYDCASITDVLPAECDALVALYNSTYGSTWANKTNWLTGNTVGSWFGVTVTANHVSSLDLHSNQLQGSIPAALGNLPFLVYLYLDQNLLAGTIPGSLGKLQSLQFLDLSDNLLEGNIPVELGDLSSLKSLWLDRNHLMGTIPPILGSLPDLHMLYLAQNLLTGTLPPELGALSHLTILDLSYNQFTGGVPSTYIGLASLLILTLTGNKLTGSLPVFITEITTLIGIDLSDNQFSGGISTKFGALPSLFILALERNQLTGVIPAALSNLTELSSLNLSSNRLTGGIPPTLGSLPNLIALNLDENQLSGVIPPELGNLPLVETIDLSNNQLTGEIPAAFSDQFSLAFLDLSSNLLTGVIPLEIGTLTNLQRLDLSHNQLEGSIPPELYNLVNLWYLSLGHNNLSGEIHPAIGNLVGLKHLDLSDNRLSGDVPGSLALLVNLCVMGDGAAPCYGNYGTDLGYNRLNLPAPEPPGDFLKIKDPDWYITQAIQALFADNQGGYMFSRDGTIQVHVQAGSFTGTAFFLLAPRAEPRHPTGSLDFAGKSFELTAWNGSGPVQTFTNPIVITLTYSQAPLGVIYEHFLKLYRWDTGDQVWRDAVMTCEGGTYYTFDPDTNTMMLPVCHLSEFALMGKPWRVKLPLIRR